MDLGADTANGFIANVDWRLKKISRSTAKPGVAGRGRDHSERYRSQRNYHSWFQLAKITELVEGKYVNETSQMKNKLYITNRLLAWRILCYVL